MKCNDKNCPEHGTLVTKGATFYGSVISDKMNKTVTIQWTRKVYIPKYERYQVKLSRIKAHNPPCINAKVGDYVQIKETRPLSKTKNFVIEKILGQKEFVKIEHEELLSKKEREKIKSGSEKEDKVEKKEKGKEE